MIGTHSVLLYPDRTAGALVPVVSNPGMTGAPSALPPVGWARTAFGTAWNTNGDGTATTAGAVAGFAGMYSTPNTVRTAGITQYEVKARVYVAQPAVAAGQFQPPVRLNIRLKFAKAAASVGAPDVIDVTFTWVDLKTGWATVSATFNDPGTWPAFATYPYTQAAFEFGPALSATVDTVDMQMRNPGAPTDLSCYVDVVTLRHGRDDTTSQPEAASATIDLSSETVDPLPPVDVGGLIVISTTLAGTYRFARFAGLITDITHTWDDVGEATPDSPVSQIIAVAPLADLGRRIVGDAPFPQELDGARVARVLNLAGVTLDPLWSDPGTAQILARDIDAAEALGVAYDAANSAGGLVWHTRAGEVRYADADHRRGVGVSLTLDACDLYVAPAWRRNLDGLVNDVSVRYGLAPEGGEQPEYRANNAGSIAARGRYAASITTDLAAVGDATAFGNLLLTRNSSPVWVLTGLPIAMPDLDLDRTRALLDLDLGSLISLTGLPSVGGAPTTAALWVEGWGETLTFDGHDIALYVSGYCRTVPSPRWNDLDPAWTWDTVSATLTWDDATCLGPPVNFGRWDDWPASTRWDMVPITTTWNTA